MKTRLFLCRDIHTLNRSRRFVHHASAFSRLRDQLISRPHNVIYDYLTPTSSHLLNVSLADLLPKSCHSKNLKESEAASYGLSSRNGDDLDPLFLPDGHHVVYFPPAIPAHSLLPDGTDTLHSPGPPFNRRMWAGGSLLLPQTMSSRVTLDGGPAACVEGIRDVSFKGTEGNEKIFVHIERRVAVWDRTEKVTEGSIDRRFWSSEATSLGNATLVERRDLVFMRDKARGAPAREDRVIKVSRTPDFSVSLRVPPSLLFRFSALTFNAHAIHLDPQYAYEVEGFPALVVHGPLSLILMLSVIKSQLAEEEILVSFNYRNLAPLYANEEIKIAVRKESAASNIYEAWIESKTRGLAVKGTAITKTVG